MFAANNLFYTFASKTFRTCKPRTRSIPKSEN
nr:MAG TPA: hypothetical protein [Caudoviricetes sp.]